MPWTPKDARKHTHKATSAPLQSLWAQVANRVLKSSGSEAKAIKAANAAINRRGLGDEATSIGIRG